ncbi:hypothetical protein [Actinocorallia aurea]
MPSFVVTHRTRDDLAMKSTSFCFTDDPAKAVRRAHVDERHPRSRRGRGDRFEADLGTGE